MRAPPRRARPSEPARRSLLDRIAAKRSDRPLTATGKELGPVLKALVASGRRHTVCAPVSGDRGRDRGQGYGGGRAA
jgi:hypothetical protein